MINGNGDIIAKDKNCNNDDLGHYFHTYNYYENKDIMGIQRGYTNASQDI